LFNIFGTKFATAVNKTDKVSYEKYILFSNDCKFQILKQDAYDAGEWFKFRIHYGIVNAGYATLEVKNAVINKNFHVVGKATHRYVSFFFQSG
jgi:hypothetical protein